MVKKICFFSRGFAFNRLNRLKYYEKIFPKDVDIYLFTTDKYQGKEKEAYQHKWDLKRTKVIVEKDSKLLPLNLRKFCIDNEIERVVNLGNWLSSSVLFFGTLFSKTKYMINILAEIFPHHDSKLKRMIKRILFFPLVLRSEKTIFNDTHDYEVNKKIFGKRINYLPAVYNSKIFSPGDQKKSRKKLGLPLNKRIVVNVGRIDYTKGSDLLIGVIDKNPDLLFIVIGRAIDENFLKIKKKARNLIYFEKKSSEELVEFYRAADLGFLPQRIDGGGLGMTTEECMGCGIPAINRSWSGFVESEAMYKPKDNIKEMDYAIKDFFRKDDKERKRLRKLAGEYALKNYSDKVWEKEYIKVHLH